MKLIYIFIILKVCYCFYLSPTSHNLINNIIKNKNTSLTIRNKVNKVLYLGYEKWAIKKALEFKELHTYKCSRIPKKELILYAKYGLYRSVMNYNGKKNFVNYSNIYIQGELRRALTDSYSLSILPKRIRMSSKEGLNETEKEHYKNLLNVETRNDVSFWYNKKKNYDMLKEHDTMYKYKILWDKINKLDPFTKRCIYLKYNYQFDKIRSNKQVSLLMCCSEEHIRTKFKNINKTFID